jgi:hypothetical protein
MLVVIIWYVKFVNSVVFFTIFTIIYLYHICMLLVFCKIHFPIFITQRHEDTKMKY